MRVLDVDDEGTKLAVVASSNGAFISLSPSKFWDMNESIFGFPSLVAAKSAIDQDGKEGRVDRER